MSAHDRDAFITAYVAHYGGTTVQADQILRGVETAYAEKQNAELHKALDDADAERVKAESETRARLKRALRAYRMCFQRSQARGWAADRASARLDSVMKANQELLFDNLGRQIDNQRLQSRIERIPQEHMRFGVIGQDGEAELLPCTDWCIACKLDRLSQLDQADQGSPPA
jgi:tRNA A37 N6-isopentenylltransferase MiaA